MFLDRKGNVVKVVAKDNSVAINAGGDVYYQAEENKAKSIDTANYNKIIEELERIDLTFFRDKDFRGSFKLDEILKLERFAENQTNPTSVFLDVKTEKLRGDFLAVIEEFIRETRAKRNMNQGSFVSYKEGTRDYYEVFYDYKNPDPAEKTISNLNKLGNEIYDKYSELVIEGKKELFKR